ncbi:MAG TPA: cation diffusion facilitator family transporter, partial [Polyangiaceae bacterium]
TGLAVNLIAAWMLSRGKESNANVRAALAHVLADAAGSVAAMAAGVLVLALGWLRADPVVSIAISLLILWGAWRLVRGSMATLMETTPRGIDLKALEATIAETPGVAGVHDLHVWSISDGFPIVSVHVVLDGESHGVDVVRTVAARLHEHHAIEHATVQPEAPSPDVVPEERLRRR